MTLNKIDRTLFAVTLVLGLAWLSIGCGPGTLGYFAQAFFPNNIEPKFKLADPKKEVTVVIASRFESLEFRPDIQPVAPELAEALAHEMRKLYKETRDNVKIVPPTRVKQHLGRIKDWSAAEMVKLGETFEADYVILLTIQEIKLMMPNTFNSLYQGRADLEVTVYDVRAKAMEAEMHKAPFRCTYPQSQPVDASNVSPGQFRAMFTSRMARDLSRWFAAHASTQKYDID